MILVNVPHMIGWCMFYFANSVTMLYASSVIMGLGVGFMEAPIITYVGEISQPELRGMLTSYAGKVTFCNGIFHMILRDLRMSFAKFLNLHIDIILTT